MSTSKKGETTKLVATAPAELPKEEKTEQDKEVLKAQVEQMFGKTDDHAPETPKRLDYELSPGKVSTGAPVAQGTNLSKEEEEFAANLSESSEQSAQPEKTPASKESK